MVSRSLGAVWWLEGWGKLTPYVAASIAKIVQTKVHALIIC